MLRVEFSWKLRLVWHGELLMGWSLQLIDGNPPFRQTAVTDVLFQSFSDGDINSYFFESPPVTDKTKNDIKFEFVLVSAKELNDVTADPRFVPKSKCLNTQRQLYRAELNADDLKISFSILILHFPLFNNANVSFENYFWCIPTWKCLDEKFNTKYQKIIS